MKRSFIEGDYYHVFNRGNGKQAIFFDDRDFVRFLFLILYFQSPVGIENICRHVNCFLKKGKFDIPENRTKEIVEKRFVELTNFILMPNHFHLNLKELKAGGISKYMQKILNGYTKYVNKKNHAVGHIFQGPFKLVHVENDPQITYLSAYIHNNARDLKEWNEKEEFYPWSSFQDYVTENRWGELLKTDIIKNQFSTNQEYKLFVANCGAKECSTSDVEHCLQRAKFVLI